ncbi:D-alanine--poly(phosphoribitol) ligase subunit DltC [Lacticaseibacillus hulanensis]|jgi:D-alanine--poly(phosphoribitol) ligase subunit 2|uniref:D-alanine--poly(phosphoribitol) ligase subunit DltC n=1 Tax=Lacticaseibacillus hulanensis TaxID=2493111 RepID=UPI000FD8C734|nr:D-alanine--poly(phosphoribitol) ligase subunit DltC [Lacticaseibacillus hulanensis]
MDTQTVVLNILEDLTGEDLTGHLDTELFDSALLDSMDTVQLVLELEEQLDVQIPVSEFNRDDWKTPQQIIDQVEKLK